MSSLNTSKQSRVLLAAVLAMTLFWIHPATARSATLPHVQRQVLPNGLVLLVSEDHTLPFVTLRFLMDAGARRDPEGFAGLANLTAEGLLLGTKNRTSSQINEQIDLLGAALRTACEYDYATLDMKVLTKNWEQGIEIFLDAILQPTFPDDQVQRKVRAIQSALAEEEDQPGVVAQKAFQKALFHFAPYGHAVEGSIGSLRGITVEQVHRYYERYYRPDLGILVIVGDVNTEDIKKSIVSQLEKWRKKELPEETVETVFVRSPKSVKIDRPVSQANIIVGHAGIARDNPDFHTVTVMNQILGGGGFASRLLREIRVQKGLAYSVSSYFEPHKYPGAFQIVLQTQNASAQQAIDIARQVMKQMQQTPVSDQELQTAKKYLIGSFPLRFASQSDLARLLAYIEYYGLGLDYFKDYDRRIERIQKEDVLSASRKYLKPDEAVIAIVADLQAAGLQ